MSNNHVSIRGLEAGYSEKVLESVFLDVSKGEFVSVIGKSGAGKTTLLNSISGLIPFKGEIRKPKKISFVFQNNSLFPWMNVEENIAFGLEKYSESEVKNILEKIGLEGREKSFPSELSGGQKQRVAIGRAIASKPDLLLMDEPFASLDSRTRTEMQDWINTILKKNSATTILVTHDVNEAILLSDRVALMKNSTLQKEFTIPFPRPRNPELRYMQEFQEIRKEIDSHF